MSIRACGYTWLAGRGHGHKCNGAKFHSGPHTCNCGASR